MLAQRRTQTQSKANARPEAETRRSDSRRPPANGGNSQTLRFSWRACVLTRPPPPPASTQIRALKLSLSLKTRILDAANGHNRRRPNESAPKSRVPPPSETVRPVARAVPVLRAQACQPDWRARFPKYPPLGEDDSRDSTRAHSTPHIRLPRRRRARVAHNKSRLADSGAKTLSDRRCLPRVPPRAKRAKISHSRAALRAEAQALFSCGRQNAYG